MAGAKDEDWSNPKLLKNISSLSPIICVCDNSAPSSYEDHQQEKGSKRASVDSENGSPSPNASQLYKQVSKTLEDRSSNGSEVLDPDVNEADVVLRRDLMKQVRAEDGGELGFFS